MKKTTICTHRAHLQYTVNKLLNLVIGLMFCQRRKRRGQWLDIESMFYVAVNN